MRPRAGLFGGLLALAFAGWALAFQLAAEVRIAALPPEARATLDLIRKGGPFPYQKDGSTFGNREGLLPNLPRGHYREYTVKTPGSRDRGARRIVAGHAKGGALLPGEVYYTDDHYRTFRRVLE
ncbi:MAG: ribonuclease [Betaproteobacteria bacterium]|nr:ribonuclease [Betaproteobacteria bacterium]